MLAFGIRYLTGFVAATTPNDHGRVEWPPHPGRVFMALAAAHFQTDADADELKRERAALRWLQGLEQDGEPAAPAIVAGDMSPRTIVTHYVPVNDKSGPSKALLQSAPVTRERQPRTFARGWLSDDRVFMVWPEAEPPVEVRDALAGLCAKVTRIGHSSSLVQMWLAEADEVGEPTWVPDDLNAAFTLRIPDPGTLEHLEQRYNAAAVDTFTALQVAAEDGSSPKEQRAARKRLREEFAEGAPSRLPPALPIRRGYVRADSRRGEAAASPGGHFGHTIIAHRLERLDGPVRELDLAAAPLIAQRWRDALLSQSNDQPPAVRRLLSGHAEDGTPLQDTHLAFVPMSFVGHPHADGHLLGMALALPATVTRDERRGVLTVVGRVPSLALGRLGRWGLSGQLGGRPPLSLLADTWTGHPVGSRLWATVTPIAFDHHPKARDRVAREQEVVEMICRACERIGLPTPRQVAPSPVSALAGALPARDFPHLRRKDGSQRRQIHALLEFDTRVCGPILLGAGRYRGYGLCRPLVDDATEA